jgi:hypothetical protein
MAEREHTVPALAAHGYATVVRDTVRTSGAGRFYERLGWTRVGVMPGYALWPKERPCDFRPSTTPVRHLA